VENHADGELLRADARETMLAIAYTLGGSADPGTLRTRPTLARCMQVSGKSLRTVQRWCRWLEARGFLLILETGTTPRFRPAILRRGQQGNLAREWRLVVPAVQESGTPWVVLWASPPRGRAGQARSGPSLRSGLPFRPVREPETSRLAGSLVRANPKPSPAGRGPTRAEMLSAAEWLRHQSLTLRRISARMLRHLLRPFWRAGWTARDVLRAVDFLPSGWPHACTDRVRDPAAWVRWRLSHWLSRGGLPLASHGQELAAAAARHRARQDSLRRQRALAAERAAGVDVGQRVAELRAIVSAALKAPRGASGPSPGPGGSAGARGRPPGGAG